MHFGCLLISENNSEDAMYKEMDIYSECNEEYFELEDYTDEVIEKYNCEINTIKRNNGEFSFELKNFLEQYPNLSEYADKEFGYETQETKDGERYGYLNNPNSFYDWCIIGGRWSLTLNNKNDEIVKTCKLKDLSFENNGFIKHFSEIWDNLFDKNYIFKDKEEKDDFEYYKRIIKEESLTKETFIDKYKSYNLSGIKWIVWPDGYEMLEKNDKEILIERLKELQKEYPEHYITVIDCHI